VVVVLPACGGGRRLLLRTPNAAGAVGLHHYEYVFPDRGIDVYDLDHHFRLVARWSVPVLHSLRGVAASPRTHMLYASVGGNGGSSGTGAVVAYDVVRNRVVWKRAFPTGTDGLACSPDGSTLFVPTGERSADDVWYVVGARTGRVRTEIHGGLGPHNTIVSPDGRFVYLGPRNSRYLVVASARTDRVLRRVGPLVSGVRPFTVDFSRGLAYTTATGFFGFQVSSLRTGRVLDTVPIRGFPPGRPGGAPSHGITLTPDGRRVFVIDVPSGYVHAYAVGGVPGVPPRHLADIRLPHPLKGKETPCGGDCGRAGWLQASLDGKYVFVGDSGDVIDARGLRIVGYLPALDNSRYQLELDWRGRVPIRTSTRNGLGYS
jgi:DNA-binding beta-propeller fold protein YncE